MGTEVTAPQTLQEKVGARIREQIGDLISDEDVKRLVETAMHEAFFKERIKRDSYERITEQKPALIVEIVRDLLKPAVEKAAAEWINANSAEVTKHIDDTLGKGVIRFMDEWLYNRMSREMSVFAQRLKTVLNLDQNI